MRLAHQDLGLTVARIFPRIFPADDGPVDFAHPACAGIADTVRRSQRYGLTTVFGSVQIHTPAIPPVPQITRKWLATNGRTLREERHEDYAHHVVAFLKHWRDDLAIDLAGWGLCRSPSSPPTLPQALTPAGARALTKTVGRAMRDAGLQTKVLVAADAVPAMYGIDFAREILADAEARDYVLAAEFHGRDGYQAGYQDWRYFDGQRHSRSEFAAVCRAYGVPTWQTESLTVRPASTHMADAMLRANHIHDDLTYGDASVWLYRWLIWEGGWHEDLGYQAWGPGAPVLVYFDEKGEVAGVEVAKLGQMMGQWSRWVRSGAHRIHAHSADKAVRISAFSGPEEGKLVLVLINNHQTEILARIAVKGRRPPAHLSCYRTSAQERGDRVTPPTLEGETVKVALAAQSITTVIAQT
jgi:O-glycosyl hydrolase